MINSNSLKLNPTTGYIIYQPTPTAMDDRDVIYLISSSPSLSDQTITEMCQVIDEIEAECQFNNWDDEGALAVSSATCSKVKYFIKMLPTNIDSPSVFARKSGAISLQWSNGSKDGLLMTFDDSLFLQVVSITKTQKSTGPIVWSYGQIPSDIRSNLLRYTKLH